MMRSFSREKGARDQTRADQSFALCCGAQSNQVDGGGAGINTPPSCDCSPLQPQISARRAGSNYRRGIYFSPPLLASSTLSLALVEKRQLAFSAHFALFPFVGPIDFSASKYALCSVYFLFKLK
jgi:hypothetical protein